MTYLRSTVFETSLLRWQQITLQDADGLWSAEYRPDAPRLILPTTRCFECQLGDVRFVCDPSVAVWLTPDSPYRMKRRWSLQRSVLLAFNADLGPAQRIGVSADMHLRFALWHRAWRQGQIEPLALEERLAAMMHGSLAPDVPRIDRPHRGVERAREYLACAPGRNDTLANIGHTVHCSPFHLARMFRRQTGRSLHRFRTELRMAQAVDRLRDGEQDLNTLAADLGYASHSHFSATFRRSFGLTPSQVRTNPTARRRHR